MSDKTEIPPLHIGAFAIAMIGGPLVFTAATFWLYFIPTIALLIGGLPYPIIGTPIALWMALTGPVNVRRALQWSGLTILVMTLATMAVVGLTESSDSAPAVMIFGIVSAIFGIAWAGTTGWLYGAMTNNKAV